MTKYQLVRRKIGPSWMVTLSPEPSFTESLYKKDVPADGAKNKLKKMDSAPSGHPAFKASVPPPRVALSLSFPQLCYFSCKHFVFFYKEMYENWDGLVLRVTLRPGTAFLYLNRTGKICDKGICVLKKSKI